MSEEVQATAIEETKEADPVMGNPDLLLSPAEQAAQDFHMFLPIFLKKLRTMPKKATERLVRQMVEFPLNEKPYQFKNQKEKEMFFVARKLMDANLVMAAEVFQQQLKGEENGKEQSVAQGGVTEGEREGLPVS